MLVDHVDDDEEEDKGVGEEDGEKKDNFLAFRQIGDQETGSNPSQVSSRRKKGS